MSLKIAFDNSYAALPARFYARLSPEPVPAPGLVRLNHALAEELGLDAQALAGPEGLAMFSGNALPEGAAPLAQAYAGHQFGGFVPQLGDGRALLLGEVIDRGGRRRDIQLKGSGRTPFSRSGDGRAWIGPVLREYVVSEAMHALGVPTTRALAAVTTGDWVYRETRLPGAVLTRVASSHIRVGTFQYFAVRGDLDALRRLYAHARDRHFPQADDPLEFLRAAVAAQARLVAQWMALGFIHGVMNTDNCHVGGETLDYGPCAFMDAYHPHRVFSSIDRHGRYAYSSQPEIAVWNLAQLASCLLPLMDMGEEEAVGAATEVVHAFPALFQEAWLDRFRAKLGLAGAQEGDRALIEALLDIMARQGADFTRSFRGLADGRARDAFAGPEAFDNWAEDWRARLAQEGGSPEAPRTITALRAANPAFIPRNHRIEAAIGAAVSGDFTPFHRLCDVLARPYEDQPGAEDLKAPPAPEEQVTQTFCGT
ncbi:protein adenylyltransferase SelO [Alkalilacustris brevis]|uniref:protein adenylyltransferase SelO n=1 Tax=Alkalilacustris brevis TaxID=2026338 RepID=UPI000E0D2BFA|nr:YdiU family protein [Alkalilacustris brevis]